MVTSRFISAARLGAVLGVIAACTAWSVAASGPASADGDGRAIAVGVIDGQLVTNFATGQTKQDAKDAALADCKRNGASQCDIVVATGEPDCIVVLGEADGSYAGGGGATIPLARQNALDNAANGNVHMADTAPILTSSCP